ncbi:hypothetical protein ACFVDH_37065, partial [Streptomyces sp. NPDC057674]
VQNDPAVVRAYLGEESAA